MNSRFLFLVIFLYMLIIPASLALDQQRRYGIHAELPMVLASNQGIPLKEQINIIRDTGTNIVRVRIRWDQIEPNQNQFNWAETDEVLTLLKEAKLEPLVILRDTPRWATNGSFIICSLKPNICPPKIKDWNNFVEQIVSRYGYQASGKKLVHYWEIWNEEDSLPMFAGTVDQYFDILSTATKTIHNVDSSSKVLMGGVTHKAILESGNQIQPSWLDELFTKPEINQAFDIFNFHLYGVVASPEETFTKVNAFINLHNLQGKPIWVTETNPSETSEELQAKNLNSWFERIFNKGAETIVFFTLPNWCQLNTIDIVWCDNNVYNTERRIGGLVKVSDFRSKTQVYFSYQQMVSSVPTTTTTIPSLNGDLNNDGNVDVIDLGILLSSWGRVDKPPADINQDGKVDVIDLGILLSNWGK